MGAPVTSGRLVTSLDVMKIDDYIKCVYEAPYANVAGYFSQLGKKEPKLKIITTKTVREVDGTETIEQDHVVTTTNYGELNPTPGTTASGFFYLIKVDYGMLIADRMVQQAISWESLNKKNYIYGGAFDTVNSQTVKEIDIVVTKKEFEEGETKSTNTTTTNHFDVYGDRSVTTVKTEVTIETELIENEPEEEGGEPTTTEHKTTVTTVTTTTMRYAYIPDVPPDQITSSIVVDPPNMNLPYNSDVSAVQEVLDQVTEVECTILKADGTTYTKNVGVTWDYSTFIKGLADTQIIYGTLDNHELDYENPIVNPKPDDYKAAFMVITKLDQVVSVNANPDVTVSSTITKGELAYQLQALYPTCTVTYNKYGSNETLTRENVPITWNAEEYDEGIVGEQIISATISDLSSFGIGNDDEIKAEVKIITEPVVVES